MKTPKNGRIAYYCNFLANELDRSELGKLLRNVGIDCSKLETADISPFQEAELFRQSGILLNDPTVAARAGSAVRSASTISAYIAKSSATLREATKNITNFYSLSDPST